MGLYFLFFFFAREYGIILQIISFHKFQPSFFYRKFNIIYVSKILYMRQKMQNVVWARKVCASIFNKSAQVSYFWKMNNYTTLQESKDSNLLREDVSNSPIIRVYEGALNYLTYLKIHHPWLYACNISFIWNSQIFWFEDLHNSFTIFHLYKSISHAKNSLSKILHDIP